MPRVCVDGNEAVARVAHALSEVCAIYPITPASGMGELADTWSAQGRTNIWGTVPRVIEMQSEAGAAGALHGAVTEGAIGTTFTASQGLLLMLPNMYKIAGELTPAVLHVAARTIATHALSIFGDHSDVMAARQTGWAMLAAASVQEAQDLAAIAHAATLASRVPFLHFFDGFRTSHEVATIDEVPLDVLRALIDPEDVTRHRLSGLSPERPAIRGTAQNPDVFFQAREAANPYHAAVPAIVRDTMARFAELTGRRHDLVGYTGAPDAERVVVLMGSGAQTAAETVKALAARGEKVGCVTVRLYRPFPVDDLLAAIPTTATRVAVLDRTKEPGAGGEPLFLDVTAALARAAARGQRPLPRVVGGRYGLSSKEFTPAMVAGVFAALERPEPPEELTVGIVDDVTHLSIPPVPIELPTPAGQVSAIFHGLGADGTVGANKNTVKIVGEHTDLDAQGYFVYDSKKSGARTVSHLRFSPEPISAPYLVEEADFVAVHQWSFIDRYEVLDRAAHGATVLLNAPHPPEEVWDHLPVEVQATIVERNLRLWVIDAYAVAREARLGTRINTVMQPCFFALAGILPRDRALAAIKDAVIRSYGKRGPEVVARNLAAIDASLDALHEVAVPATVTATRRRRPVLTEPAPEFVERVTARIMAGEGDLLPVSALPADGTFPTGTARYERRRIAQEIPIWDPDICIDCGKCAIVCPHAAIQMKVFDPAALEGAPEHFLSKEFKSRELPGHRLTVQVSPDDCTGCSVCVEACPVTSKTTVGHKAINMCPIAEHEDVERERDDFFRTIPYPDRDALRKDTVKGAMTLQPLFEYSGACAGCGETPYLKLLTQLFGDRLVIANATGCSSIYGGNLPTTPWGTTADGRGPVWSNSLFEDNAEFGLGMRLGLDQRRESAQVLLAALADQIGDPQLVEGLLAPAPDDETSRAEQRERLERLRARLAELDTPEAAALDAVADALLARSVWIVGGDGWAYDIGYGGLDHVLASGENVNVLVLDTEVYSNTGGQASKATGRGAVAKFAAAGKAGPKKDLGALAMQYGNVYVAQIALGANEVQTVRTLLEAEAWEGPSLVVAYSTCIAHGVDMKDSMHRMDAAVRSGYWPLYRFRPTDDPDARPFTLDAKPPSMPVREFMAAEARFAMLQRTQPERAAELAALAQADVDERWRYYTQLAGVERTRPGELDGEVAADDPADEDAPGGGSAAVAEDAEVR